METKANKIYLLMIYAIFPIIASIVYVIEEPIPYLGSNELIHRIGSIFGIFAFIWMCFNIIIMTKIRVIETNYSLDWLNKFHMWTAVIAIILGSLHYPLIRLGGAIDPTQLRTGNFGWASFIILMLLAKIFMSNRLVKYKAIGKLRLSAFIMRFKYDTNKILHNVMMVGLALIFYHSIISFTSISSVYMLGIYYFFFGITIIGWFYHKLIRRFRSTSDPYAYRKSSWDDVGLDGVSEKDRKWAFRSLKQNPSLYPCLQCGTCTSECPVSIVTKGNYNPRRNILTTLLGYKDLLLKGDDLVIWGCTDCHTCNEVCPQGIELTDLFASLKNQSIALGKGPDYIIEQAITIFDNAKAIPSQPAIERRRQELGLPAVSEPNISEVQTLLTNLGIKDKIELRT
ncbi:MAG: 4Fe-4S dicluster domain-containing protein [Candidatus Lokiarchaeota archaeon]|nr:4Fe-4S dicluster domain-containing protein [Candidatus Lokiarchaeota archaeon]